MKSCPRCTHNKGFRCDLCWPSASADPAIKEQWYIVHFYRRGAAGMAHVKARDLLDAVKRFERGNPGASGIRATMYPDSKTEGKSS